MHDVKKVFIICVADLLKKILESENEFIKKRSLF